jgi:DNA-binding protein HU-beta
VERIGCTELQANRMVTAFTQRVRGRMRLSGSVWIPNVGTWYVSSRQARGGRNPRTGEQITIKPAKVVRFRPARAYKDQVRAYGVTTDEVTPKVPAPEG